MVYLYIGAAVVVGLLIGFVALAVKQVSQKVTANIRDRAAELLSSYDRLIERKSRQLKKVAEELSDRQDELQELDSAAGIVEGGQSGNGTGDPSYVLNVAEKMAMAPYQDPRTGMVYQKIRTNFTRDAMEIIREIVPDMGGKGPATALLEQIDYDTVYKLSAMSSEDQEDIMRESLNEECIGLLDEFMAKKKKFQAIEFYDFLAGKAMAEPQAVRLKVSPNQNIPYLPEGVDVVVDEDICEGFEVEADNKLYDFCVRKSEIS